MQSFLLSIPTTHGEAKVYDNIQIVVLNNDDPVIRQSAVVLLEEIEKRANVNIQIVSDKGKLQNNTLTVFIGLETSVSQYHKNFERALSELGSITNEGFKVKEIVSKSSFLIAGFDSRACLYGVGYFLRKMLIEDGKINTSLIKNVSSSPEKRVRGQGLHIHRQGVYEPWGIAYFEQYVRDLVLFGMNTVELATDITAAQIEVSKKYGMDVWLYDPCDNNNQANGYYFTEDGLIKQMERRKARLGNLPTVDAVFVPGGDPGTLDPIQYFEWLDHFRKLLMELHPGAKIWVSMQSFHTTNDWVNTFVAKTNERKEWLGGFVYAPWTKATMTELRERIDPSIPMVTMPDICHPMNAQYPVLNLDLAYAMTYGRSSINPLPVMQKHIHNLYEGCNIGSITYSEANYDDVNKFIWSGQDWNSHTDVKETLKDYARFFLGINDVNLFVEGILALEKNFDGPIVENQETIASSLKIWQQLENSVDAKALENPRFQMLLFKAYYDMYQKERLIFETESERLALEALANAKPLGSATVISQARSFLNRKISSRTIRGYQKKCLDIYSRDAKSGSLNTGENYKWLMEIQQMSSARNIDFSLNDRDWLFDSFRTIERMGSESARCEAIAQIVNRTKVVSNEYYDNLGSPESLKRIKGIDQWSADPGTIKCPRVYFGSTSAKIPLNRRRQITTLYDEPLTVTYNDLDKKSGYILRVVYEGLFNSKIQLEVDGVKLHEYMLPEKSKAYTFTIPKKLTEDGKVNFTWKAEEGQTVCQVSELWLLKTE